DLSTRSASMRYFSPDLSAAWNEMSSSSRSITVCSRRAPMFSVRSLTWNATSASRSIPESVNSSPTPSVPSRATYCLVNALCGSRRIRLKSSTLSADSSTRIGRLGQRERAGGDEQHVVGLDRAVLGGNGGALHQRQQVALHAFAADPGVAVVAALGHLVDLVEEDDAVLLGVLHRLGADLLVVEQLAGLLVDQQRARGLDRQLAGLGLGAAQVLEHLAQLRAHLLHARRRHDLHADVHRQLQIDLPLV